MVIYPEWRGLPLLPSKAAMNELLKFGMTLQDVKNVLEHGEASGKKRQKGIHERTLPKGSKRIKVVVARSYNYSFKTDCWIVVHVGRIER